MEIYNNPDSGQWEALCKRPEINRDSLNQTVGDIMEEVRLRGDAALREYTKKLDQVSLMNIAATKDELKQQAGQVAPILKKAIVQAKNNIWAFHEAQTQEVIKVETMPGVWCWQKSVAIQKVGLYVPGGSAPLFSSLLMLGIPAKIAGCETIVVCTPPTKEGLVPSALAYCCLELGITQVYKIGGAQAIAAMTYGTQSIPKVYKIFGPGNQYVTKAKEFAQQAGLAIDMPAGPSELMVVANATCNPEFVAADLLSQAEHGADSQVMLLTDSVDLIHKIKTAIADQLNSLPRKEIAKQALLNSKAICFDSLEDAMNFSNTYAPEHLILATNKAHHLAELVINAGSVFIGNYTPESAGDYASGTNHTLPTNGYAKQYSGVNLSSFTKKITYQEITKKGIQTLGATIEVMAAAEGLQAHKTAVSVRLKQLNNE